jgi:hypothetical protein
MARCARANRLLARGELRRVGAGAVKTMIMSIVMVQRSRR